MKWIYTSLCIFFIVNASAQQKDSIITTSAEVHVFKPEMVPATPDNMKPLKLPDGFSIAPLPLIWENLE